MPHLNVRDGTVEEGSHAIPVRSADDVVGPGHDGRLPSVSRGADEDAVLIHLHDRALDGDHNVRPSGGAPVAREDYLRH